MLKTTILLQSAIYLTRNAEQKTPFDHHTNANVQHGVGANGIDGVFKYQR